MLSARKIAYEIYTGKRPKQFIVHKTKEVLQMELFSLKNRYNPNTMTNFEKYKFEKELNKAVEGILSLSREQRANLYGEVDKMLNP